MTNNTMFHYLTMLKNGLKLHISGFSHFFTCTHVYRAEGLVWSLCQSESHVVNVSDLCDVCIGQNVQYLVISGSVRMIDGISVAVCVITQMIFVSVSMVSTINAMYAFRFKSKKRV